MKRGVLLTVIFILCLTLIPSVFAADKLLLSGWYFSGDSFKEGTDILRVSHLHFEDNKIYLSVNTKSFVLNLEECKLLDGKKYCFEEVFRDKNSVKSTDHIKFDGLNVYAGLKIGIYSVKNEITVSRSFSSTKPSLNEEVGVTITVSNPTDLPVSKFIYTDEYPQGVYFTSSNTGVQITSRTAKIETKLNPNSDNTYKYYFKINDYLKFSSKASYQYDIGSGLVNVNISSVAFDLSSSKPFNDDFKISKSSLETGEESLVTLSIKNLVSEDLDVELVQITPPPKDVTLSLKTKDLYRDNSLITWSGVVKNGTTQLLELGVKPVKSGKYNIPVSIRIKQADGVYYVSSKNISFSASYKQPELILSIKDPSVFEGSTFRTAFSVKNPNSYTSYKNVNAIIKSNISSEESGFIEEILPGQTKTIIIKESIFAPSVVSDTSFLFSASGRFDTFYGEFGNFTKSGSVKVSPVNKSVSIIKKLEKTTMLRPKDNLTITVSAKSNLAQNIDIYIKESIPAGAKIVGGNTEANIKFDTPVEKNAYIYTIQIPENYDKKELYITTFLRINDQKDLLNQTTMVLINISDISDNNSLSKPNSDLEYDENGNLIVNKDKTTEKSTFTKIVDGVTNFFSRIFGK